MASRSHAIYNNQSAVNYINKKGIDELFEAIMTALMVHRPDDHITFIRECLDKVQKNPNHVRWDLFVTNTKGALPSRPALLRSRQKALPPVRSLNTSSKTSQSLDRRTAMKSSSLPPIDNVKRATPTLPVMFILSATNSTKLCARLVERYNRLTFLSVEDIANIDYDERIDLSKQDHRFTCVQNAMEHHRANVQGFIIAGHLNERHFLRKWHDKLGRIDLIVALTTDRLPVPQRTSNLIQINPRHQFDAIVTEATRAADEIFSLNINLLVRDEADCVMHSHFQTSHTSSTQAPAPEENKFSLPIIFCIDNYQLPVEEVNRDKLTQRPSLDVEFEINDEENEEESNNSFIYALSERLAEDFSFKPIHYGDFKKSLLRFDQLKAAIIDSMSTCTGYVIDRFPTSYHDLQKFQAEVGPCSALIYIGEQQLDSTDAEFNTLVAKLKEQHKAIYVDGRVEVDEIYEDLKKEILERL